MLPDAGLVVVLSGPLGAGKTVFAKGLAEGLGVPPDDVTSPTFAICSEYPTPRGLRLAHVDGYRVADAAELEAAGLLDWLAPGTVVVVEWGERFADALGPDRLAVEISPPDFSGQLTRRRLNAVACGPAASRVLARWEAALEDELPREA